MFGFSVLLCICLDSAAQSPSAAGPELLHGSVFSAQGQPAAEAVVELRDLRGIKVASAVTDGSGNFQIDSAATPGEYVFLATSGVQVRDEQVLLALPGLELSVALPAAAVTRLPESGRYMVSAKQLGIPAKARERLVAARQSFRKLKFDQAEKETDGALRADPGFAEAFTMRALIRLAEKDFRGAMDDARRAAALDAEDTEALVALATSYNSLREFENAEDAAWHAVSLRPDCWQGRLELAKAWYGQGRLVRALREMDDLNQDFPDVHLVRANVLARLNRAQEAAEEFEHFLRQAPDDPRSAQVKRIVERLAASLTPPISAHH
jgi:tetratricopeptide (TPR) repeat protein